MNTSGLYNHKICFLSKYDNNNTLINLSGKQSCGIYIEHLGLQ